MSRIYLDDAVWFHEPTYAAHLNCPVVIPALLAEVFVSARSTPRLDTFDQSVGGTFIERHLIDWTARADRLRRRPPTASSPAAAPSPTCRRCCSPATERSRRRGDPARLRILASADGHFSVQKSARLLGLGDDAVVTRPGRRRPPDGRRARSSRALAALRRRRPGPDGRRRHRRHHRLRRDRPAARDRRRCARTYDTWLHVDAAYGGGLLVSPTPPAPARRHRARRLGDRRLPQDLVPAGLVQRALVRDGGHLRPRHLARRLPQPARGRGAHPQPGRQEPADHPPLRRAEAVADAAGDGPRPDRRATSTTVVDLAAEVARPPRRAARHRGRRAARS